MPEWEYDEASHRYRNKANGRYLSPTAAVDLRDDFQRRARRDLTRLAERLGAEDLTVQQWEAQMRTLVRQIHGVEFIFGRGGKNALTTADELALRSLVADQWAYLHRFAEDVRAGLLSEGQIRSRAHKYAASSRQAYERGRAAAFGVQLPAYPGQGSECQSSCACSWSIVEADDEFRCTWKLGSGDSCPTCKRRASTWAPLVIAKSTDGRIARLWRSVA